MNNTSNHDSSSSTDNNAQAQHCPFESFRRAASEGAHRARAAAEQAVPKIKSAVSGATFWVGYGAAFASVFSCVVLKELAPEPLKAGCREGAQAGRKAAEDLAAKRRANSDPSGPASSPEADPSGPAMQPGGA